MELVEPLKVGLDYSMHISIRVLLGKCTSLSWWLVLLLCSTGCPVPVSHKPGSSQAVILERNLSDSWWSHDHCNREWCQQVCWSPHLQQYRSCITLVTSVANRCGSDDGCHTDCQQRIGVHRKHPTYCQPMIKKIKTTDSRWLSASWQLADSRRMIDQKLTAAFSRRS